MVRKSNQPPSIEAAKCIDQFDDMASVYMAIADWIGFYALLCSCSAPEPGFSLCGKRRIRNHSIALGNVSQHVLPTPATQLHHPAR
jgi:hypothetical protein